MTKLRLPAAFAVIGTLLVGACAYSPPQEEPPTPSPIESQTHAASPEGVVELAWERPEQRLSGSELEENEIAAYRIYYGDEPESYEDVVEVEPDQPMPHTVQGLEPGKRYYFAITAVDNEGRESPRSSPIALTAEAPSGEEPEQTQAALE